MFEPTTEGINNIIAAIAKEKHQIVNPWIGIHHLHDEGRTVFARDKTTVAWSNWDANEPNNENNEEDCAHMHNEGNEYNCKYQYLIGEASGPGNGYCDDWSNNEECDWDGGDCCGNYVDTKFCIKCECRAPNFEVKQCNYKQIGNGICNDELNNEECKWDGGDCCGIVGMAQCSACECLEPFRWNDDNCDEFRRFICEKEGTG